MVSLLLHIDAAGLPSPRLAELYAGVATLLERLRQQGVPPALLLQCAAVTDAGTSLASLQAAAGAATAPLLLAQPGQLSISLRLALDQLAPADPASIVFVSVADSTGCATQAATLGCTSCEHLPARSASGAALQAAALQAVAWHVAEARLARGLAPALLVGYAMKESRQLALGKQGMLPLLPPAATAPEGGAARQPPDGGAAGQAPQPAAPERPLCFFPLDLGSPLAPQLRHCHIVLQKLSDHLLPSGGGSGAVAQFTPEATALLAHLEQQQHAAMGTAGQEQQQQAICLVDSAAALRPALDRAALVQHLEAAALAVRQQAIPMRAPATVLLRGFDAAATPRALAAAGVGLPCIVKPQAACGMAEAHQMAFVLNSSGFADLEVPLPALAQEYVDHGGVVWKVYVAGQQVFWAQRRSTPDLSSLAERLAADPEADIPSSIGFDSLQSLPTTLPWLRGGGGGGSGGGGGGQAPSTWQPHEGGGIMGSADQLPAVPGQVASLMRQPTFEAVAAALRQRLGLTLFGFDLVFDRVAGELVIIDVNYFPSYKGIPEAPAALQAALRERYAVAAVATGGDR